MKYFLIIFFLLLSPILTQAASLTVDLGITSDDIFFNQDGPLRTGEHIRLYARVNNHGDEDVEGYVLFYQGSIAIGQSQVISVRHNGAPEEVFVDFVVPNGSFNIRADIKGTNPVDQNPSNDSAMTKLYVPISDQDNDLISDSEDNCPKQANNDQKDTDSDGIGDICDNDNNNNGIPDVEEVKKEPKVDTGEKKVPENNKQSTEDFKKIVANLIQQDNPDLKQNDQPIEELIPQNDFKPSVVIFSPEAIFSYSRLGWNKFRFKAISPNLIGYQFAWDFGDGVVSNKAEVDHQFNKDGDFKIALKIISPEGQESEDSTIISIPFFSLENNYVIAMIGGLFLLLLIGLIFMFKLSSNKKIKIKKHSILEEDLVVTPMVTLKETEPKKRKAIKKIKVRDGD